MFAVRNYIAELSACVVVMLLLRQHLTALTSAVISFITVTAVSPESYHKYKLLLLFTLSNKFITLVCNCCVTISQYYQLFIPVFNIFLVLFEQKGSTVVFHFSKVVFTGNPFFSIALNTIK